MKKFKELLFLMSIYRVGKVKINNDYLDIVKNSNDFNELINNKIINNKYSKDKLDKALEKCEKIYNYIINSDIEIITIFDDNYPEKLKIMGNKKPLFLYIKGNKEALTNLNIGIVGTRKPSNKSKSFEKDIVKSIVEENRTTVSGLALGCDKIAHKATIDNNGITIAILPSGIDKITPSSNKKLAKEILEKNGCLISEYEPTKSANKGSYVERDKIIAAISDVTLIIECSEKSGTMHTANAVIEYEKDLYAYLPEDPAIINLYTGNKLLIKENKATKVNDIKAFCEELAILNSKKEQPTLKDF